MTKFVMAIECKCKVAMCEHSEYKMTEIIQEAYDEGYDDGWDAAFAMLHSVLKAKGINPPSETPPAPARSSRRAEKLN